VRTDKPQPIALTLLNLKETLAKRKKYIKNEHQAYGLQLAAELNDWTHRPLYIRLAKTQPRKVLETARLFVTDQTAGTVKSKAKLFMWKLKQLRSLDKTVDK
jgi:hypothetical protein